jgi:hypothetical protein
MNHKPFENLASDLVKLHPETVANAEVHAKVQKKARRKKPVAKTPRKVIDHHLVRVPAEVLQTALKLAGGDMRRIELQPDGSALVLNHPRTTKPQENR